jgi:glycosyltransferase involved in cell wall biosynthesis
MNELPKLKPVSILLTTYNRLSFLKKAINLINERTLYPYRLIVVSNHCTDGTLQYLKESKVLGRIWDYLYLDSNVGQSVALNRGVALINDWEKNKRRPSSDFIVTTNEDISPPKLFIDGKGCWLEKMIYLFEKHESEGLGALAMRIERTARQEIDESKDLIYMRKGIPSVFRLVRRTDLAKLGEEPYGKLLHFDSNSTADSFQTILKKKIALTTHIYGSHFGFMVENKGYDVNDKDYFTYSGEAKLQVFKEKPYADINPETNVPIKINHACDALEQQKRNDHQKELNGELEKPEVTIIVLTCHRYDGLKRVIDSIRKNTNDVLYKLLVVADGDDVEGYNYCLEQNIPCILSSERRDFVAQANLGIYACQTPYFVKIDDDMEIIEKDWLSRALKVFKEKFPDNNGLLSLNDGIQHGSVFTVGMSSKKFVSFIGGNLYYPRYVHFGGDRELVRLSKGLGCYYYEETIKVVHHHWQSVEGVVEDETYKLSKNKFWRQDQELKKERGNVDVVKEKNYYDYLN